MNFKERLNINNKLIENDNKIEFKQEVDISDIFMPDNIVSEVIKKAVSENKNIIVASSIDCDNTICTQYIKTFIKDTDKIEVLYDINSGIQFIKANRIIVPDIDILGFVKILEFILYGYNSFIFTINVKSYENILESIKTLISLYYSNLSESAAENLIGASNSIIVYINKNDDGLFYISNIGLIEYKNNKIKLIELFPMSENFQEENEEKTVRAKTIAELSDETDIKQKSNEKSENIKRVKINKYKLLKEKIKSKRQSI